MHHKALTITKTIIDEDHHDIVMSNTNIGIVMYNSANYDGTLDMHQKALMVYKKVQVLEIMWAWS